MNNELINIISYSSIACSILFVILGVIFIRTKEKYIFLGYINIYKIKKSGCLKKKI